jgi:ankyrin repeat protein
MPLETILKGTEFQKREEALKLHKLTLRKDEVIGLRLYTGPAYYKYNTELRNAYEKQREQGLREGGFVGAPPFKFVATVHAIYSGLIKLAQIEQLQGGNRICYRGIGLKLPESMLQPDALGFKGGCEVAFMSSARELEVAVFFLNQPQDDSANNILEIQIGQVDRGASLKWLSQYPEEDEVLFPPLSYIETVGIPREEEVQLRTGVKRTVNLHTCRLNVNQRTGKLEDHVMRRKRVHISMIRNAYFEVERDLDQKCRELPVGNQKGTLKGPRRGKVQEEGHKIKGLLLKLCKQVFDAHHAVEEMDYYKENLYHALVEEAASIYEQAKVIFEHWQADTSTYYGDDLLPKDPSATSLAKIYRIICGCRMSEYRAAKLEAQAGPCEVGGGGTERRREREREGEARGGSSPPPHPNPEKAAAAADVKTRACKALELFNQGKSQDALRHAASTNNAPLLKLLLDAGVYPDFCARDDPLTCAAQMGSSQCTQLLLTAPNASLATRKFTWNNGGNSSSPLYYAAYSGSVETVKELLKHGCVHDNKTIVKSLCIAARRGNLPAFQQIWLSPPALQRFDERLLGPDDRLPELRFRFQEAEKDFLGKYKPRHNCLGEACWTGYANIVRYLWKDLDDRPDARADFFTRPCKEWKGKKWVDGRSALHFAALYGHLNVVEFLASTHLWENESEKHMQGLLHLAFKCNKAEGKMDIIRFMVKRWPNLVHKDVWERSTKEESLLHVACRAGDAGTLKWLFGQELMDADRMDANRFERWITRPLNKQGDLGLNCFHLACKSGKFEVIQFLIQTLDESILKKCLRFPSDKSQHPPSDLNEYVKDLFSQIRARGHSTNSRWSGSQAHNRTLENCWSSPAANHVSKSSPSNQQTLRRNDSTSSDTSTSSAMSYDADSNFQHAQEETLKALIETKTKNQLSVLDVLRDPQGPPATIQRQPAARTSALSACAAEFVPGK